MHSEYEFQFLPLLLKSAVPQCFKSLKLQCIFWVGALLVGGSHVLFYVQKQHQGGR